MQVEGSLRKWRLERNYKQTYMATQLGISQQCYQKLETGKTKLLINKAEHIALLLEVPLSHIYTSAVLAPPAAPEAVTLLYERLLHEKDQHITELRHLLDVALEKHLLPPAKLK